MGKTEEPFKRRDTFCLFSLKFFFPFSFFIFFVQLEEFRMNKIILIGLSLSVITVELKSMKREKAAGNAEQPARQLDQKSATFESREENGEEQVQKLQKLQKMLRIQQELMQAEREAADPQSDTSRQDFLSGLWNKAKKTLKSVGEAVVPTLLNIAKEKGPELLAGAFGAKSELAREEDPEEEVAEQVAEKAPEEEVAEEEVAEEEVAEE